MTPTRTVVVAHDPVAFLSAAGDFLRRSPVAHSVLLSRSAQALHEARQVQALQLWPWVLDERGEVVAAAMRTPPHGLQLSRADEHAVRVLADELAARGIGLPGVGGQVDPVTAFAARWRELTGVTFVVHQRHGTYRADVVRAPGGVPGRRRLARADDAARLRGWAEEFERETQTIGAGTDHVGWRIEQRLLHVWERDGSPVSMAAATAPQAGVSRVQLVYTPPAERGRGWAGALVAALSQQVLDAGAVPMLYTDLANPVANALYQRLGYTAVEEQLVLRLPAAAPAPA